MNKKTLIIAIMLCVLLVVLVLAYFLILKPSVVDNIEASKNTIKNEFFSIKLPEGWVEVDPVYNSVVMAIKGNEQTNDINAQKLGFVSYYSVLNETFSENTEQEYLNKIKDSLRQNFTGATVSDEEVKEIDNKKIYFIESSFNQQNVDFKVLLAVNIEGESAWIISFNTLEGKWEEYKNLFYDIAENFKIK
jgi:hypothetical protein